MSKQDKSNLTQKQAFVIADWISQIWYQLGKMPLKELPKRRKKIMESLLYET